MFGVDADAPEDAVADGALDVGRGAGVAAGATSRARRSRAPGRRCPTARSASTNAAIGPLPRPSTVAGSPSSTSSTEHLVDRLRRLVAVAGELRAAPAVRRVGQVLVAERRPHLRGGDLAALGVGVRLDDLGELDLQPARQVEVVLGLHDVGDAALAGLAVDPDDRLVAAADVLRVDRQVGHGPGKLVDRRRRPRPRRASSAVEALLDGVLVRAGEGGVDEVAAVGVARVHGQLVAVLDGAADLVDVGEVDLRVDALARTGSGPA